MKNAIIITLIALNFILTQLEIFLPLFSDNVNVLALLIINLILLFVITIVQERPSVMAIEEDRAVLDEFHIAAYLTSAVICCLIEFVFIVGYFSFGWEREHIYDLILLLIPSFLLLLSGREFVLSL